MSDIATGKHRVMWQVEDNEGRVYKGWDHMCHLSLAPFMKVKYFWLGLLGLVEFNTKIKDAGWQNGLAPFKVNNVNDLVVMVRKTYDPGIAEKSKVHGGTCWVEYV